MAVVNPSCETLYQKVFRKRPMVDTAKYRIRMVFNSKKNYRTTQVKVYPLSFHKKILKASRGKVL